VKQTFMQEDAQRPRPSI